MSSMEKKLDTSISLFYQSKFLLHLAIYTKSLTILKLLKHIVSSEFDVDTSDSIKTKILHISHYMKSVDGDFNAEF